MRRYETTSGRALNRTLELLLKLRLAGENSGFATTVAADLSAAIATAQTNDTLLTAEVLQPNAEPAPAPNEANGDHAIATSGANAECENAPNEPNPASPEHQERPIERLVAVNRHEVLGDEPTSGMTGVERTDGNAELVEPLNLAALDLAVAVG